MKVHAFRLLPGQDLFIELERFAKEKNFSGGIITCVGSLKSAVLRFAAQKELTHLTGPYEITSLAGTLSPTGLHLHIALSDTSGKLVGGHLKPGSFILTTAEIILCSADGLQFTRKLDPDTGYSELEVEDRRPST